MQTVLLLSQASFLMKALPMKAFPEIKAICCLIVLSENMSDGKKKQPDEIVAMAIRFAKDIELPEKSFADRFLAYIFRYCRVALNPGAEQSEAYLAAREGRAKRRSIAPQAVAGAAEELATAPSAIFRRYSFRSAGTAFSDLIECVVSRADLLADARRFSV